MVHGIFIDKSAMALPLPLVSERYNDAFPLKMAAEMSSIGAVLTEKMSKLVNFGRKFQI